MEASSTMHRQVNEVHCYQATESIKCLHTYHPLFVLIVEKEGFMSIPTPPEPRSALLDLLYCGRICCLHVVGS